MLSFMFHTHPGKKIIPYVERASLNHTPTVHLNGLKSFFAAVLNRVDINHERFVMTTARGKGIYIQTHLPIFTFTRTYQSQGSHIAFGE